MSPSKLLEVADLDGNGRPDLLLGATARASDERFGRSAIMRVMQDSDERFGLPVEIFTEMAEHQSLYVADVDGDKRLDFVESSSNTHTAHFGRADGSFSERIVGMSVAQSILEVSDVDADGSADLIAIADDRLVVMGPPPDLTWRATLRVPRPAGRTANFGSHIFGVKVRDLDGDTRPELIAVTADDELRMFTEVFVRTGDEWQPDTRSWAADPQTNFEYIADFNHDGIPDRVTFDDGFAERPRVFIATGDGAGKFRKHEARQLPEHGVLHLGDFDGDGHLDIASLRESITVLRGRGDGSLEKPRSFALPNVNTHAMSVLMTDFDLDGSPDLVGVDFGKVFVASRACIEPN